MKKESIVLVLLLITTICFSQTEGWITDKTTGCKYYTLSNVDKRYIKWTGNCVDGYVSGYGTLMVFQSDTLYYTYVGTCQSGKMNGQGSLNRSNGTKYVGGFKEGNEFGQGICIFPNGGKYEGEWKDGIMNGHGTMYYAQTSNPLFNGRKYIGEWKDGERYGNGVETLENGVKMVYSLIDGKRYYKLYHEDGKLYEEGFLDVENSKKYSNE